MTRRAPRRAAEAIAALAVALSVAACHEGSSLPPRGNILLITVDTLRADHLSSYGYPRQTSPVLDRLAAEGVRFDRPSVQWPKTGPSFASIFSSTYPKDNGIVRQIGIPVPEELSLLAERLSAAGFATAAVVSNGALGTEFNFDQGFERYVQTWKVQGVEGDPNRAGVVTDEALAVAAELDPARPFFLWVHYLDPHFPYTPPEEYADRFIDDEHFDPTVRVPIDRQSARRQMAAIGRDMVLEEREDLAFYEARYDAEILYADTEIGRLLDGLGGSGRLDGTVIAMTSDHGESLGEHHYYFDHGRFAFQTCLRVPLILSYPGVIEPRVDPDPVQLIDLAPTLLELAGVALDDGAWMQGESLVDRLLGDPDGTAEPRLAFSEAGYATGGKWQRVVQDRRYKLVLVRGQHLRKWFGSPEGDQWVLYDLEADPAETVDVSDVETSDARRLQKALVAWINAEPFDVGAQSSGEQGEMDDDTRKQLEALGYLD
jgi:arylsulfatase A-like enzyme